MEENKQTHRNAFCLIVFLPGPSRIFFIWSLYLVSSTSSFAIFFSTDSVRESMLAMQSVRFGGGSFGFPRPNRRPAIVLRLQMTLLIFERRKMNPNFFRGNCKRSISIHNAAPFYFSSETLLKVVNCRAHFAHELFFTSVRVLLHVGGDA